MASSYISNALQINFDSVLSIQDNYGIVNMFRALEATGLRGFLGCSSVLYEQELEQFFDTALIQDEDITCAISGKYVAISPIRFAGVFNLPNDGLIDLSEVPNDLVLKARTLFSRSAVTHERFLMMTAIHYSVNINWSTILFEILKEMVDRTTKRAKGFAAQICVLLKGDPAVTLGDATIFSPLKILSEKTVHTYVATNKTIDSRGDIEEPEVAKVAVLKRRTVSKKKSATTVDKKADVALVQEIEEKPVSKKRPAVVTEAKVAKKKKTTSGKSAAQPSPPKRKAPKRKLKLTPESDEEIVEKAFVLEAVVVEQKEPTSVDDPAQCLDSQLSFIKTWGWYRVCTEVLRYSMFGCLKPVSRFTVCTDIVPVGPVTGAFSMPRRVVDNSSYRIQILDSVPTDFVSSRHHQSSSSTSSMHFSDDIVHDSFTDLQTTMSRIISLQSNESRRLANSHSEVLDKIKVESTILEAFYQQNQSFHRLLTRIQQEGQNETTALSLGLKAVRTQTTLISNEQEDARKEAKEQKAIITDMDESLATLRGKQLDFRAQAQENYNNLSSQLGELVAYINRGNDQKGEGSSSHRPQPPPDDQNRPNGGNVNKGGGGGDSSASGRRDYRRSSSMHKGSGSSSAGGGYKKSADWWLFGKNQ
ncbi:hypothetical protein F511_33385 [Dorcoceras hygrometricum]|uniref:Uncharacterized protein n=1 Tax=Dorcoceras hygrometricum TaxID=472368 RepID=A0A2Z7DC34_9LAMI|nr:hypothetical protein F511_33385 [Dorcoceras hygrometricum]